jgi:hypothetical protein
VREVWKPILGYGGLYEVSDLGNVRSLDREVTIRAPSYTCKSRIKGRVLKPGRKTTPYGATYFTVDLCRDGKISHCYIHILVAKTFLGDRSDTMEVNHKHGNTTDNRLSELEWMTRKDNAIHARRVLRKCLGEKAGRAKLKEEQVLEIRERHRTTGATPLAMAPEYDVHVCTIQRILANTRWRHI